jgi:hypothetical protein
MATCFTSIRSIKRKTERDEMPALSGEGALHIRCLPVIRFPPFPLLVLQKLYANGIAPVKHRFLVVQQFLSAARPMIFVPSPAGSRTVWHGMPAAML